MKVEKYVNVKKVRLSDKQNEFIKRKSIEYNLSESDYLRILIDFFIINESEDTKIESSNRLRFNDKLQ